ncbi:helix-turn-helix domain-containing protein [Diplocloster modestus]|uniref:helix-turn-helix domain-containing protein n=1 Tax=Diplocloster modestus TaxID=2850322 RepID=UPI00130DD5ED
MLLCKRRRQTLKLGKNLSHYRHAAGFTQCEAANILNISRQCLSNWETDHREPRIGDIIEMCQLYNITINQLVYGKNI